MPDLPIVLPDTAAAPKDYTLSGTQELALKTVRALIDGSGAATAFLPTLQLLDPNGHVMWEGASPGTVAAGGSADVSWFPGLGSGSKGSGVTPDWQTFFTSTVLVASGGNFAADFNVDSGTSLLDLTNPTIPKVQAQGLYTLHTWVQSSDAWTADSVGGAQIRVSNASDYPGHHVSTAIGTDTVFRNTYLAVTAIMRANDTFGIAFENFDSAGRHMFSNDVYLVQHFTF